jgi:DNA-directed RNA polymerase specialized sigma24 family protein
MATGWTVDLLAAELGRHPKSVHRSMTGRSVTARTAHDVAALYERLWNTTPPQTTSEQRAAADTARAHAAVQGWLPPLAWDDFDTDPPPPPPTAERARRDGIDEIAVERALAGGHISYDDLTSVEQQEAVRRLSARGASIRDIAALLGTTKRTISRRRANLGAA